MDTIIDIMMYPPVVLDSKLEEKQMSYYRSYMKNFFEACKTAKRFIQIRIPTEENTKQADMSFEEYKERMEQAYAIDYERLYHDCEQRVRELEGYSEICIKTGANEEYSLYLQYKDRQGYIDAGDGELPCGEVYIVPIEGQTEGTIFFEKIYVRQAGLFENVIFTVQNGRIIKCNIPEIKEAFESLPEIPVVCELGFGMNANVIDLCGYPLLDEKMRDSFHIVIGDNTMFGGSHEASYHIDMIGKGRIGGRK